MSKAEAMAMMTGQPTNNVNPSLITGGMPKETGLSPGIDVPQESAPTSEAKNIDSDRFAMLAKKEARLQREREEWKVNTQKERAEIEDLKKRLKDPYDKIQEFEKLRGTDPIAALKSIGFSETEIFNYMAGQEKKEPTVDELARAAASEEVNKYKEEQAKIANDTQKTKETALIEQYSSQISTAIKANPEKYEYSNYYGSVATELAMEFATENVKMNGDLLSPEEIAQAVEDYYEEQDKAMSVIKKRNPAPSINPPPEVGVKKELRTRTLAQTPGQQPMKTLTNKVAATAASTITRRETHEQKKDRLISALKAGTYVPRK